FGAESRGAVEARPHLRQDDPRSTRVALPRLRRDAGRVLRRLQRRGVPPPRRPGPLLRASHRVVPPTGVVRFAPPTDPPAMSGVDPPLAAGARLLARGEWRAAPPPLPDPRRARPPGPGPPPPPPAPPP